MPRSFRTWCRRTCIAALAIFAATAWAGTEPGSPVPDGPAATDAAPPASAPAAAPVPDGSLPPSSVTAPAPDAAATTELPPAAPPAKVVLLPVEFTVYQRGVGAGEVVADWTSAARSNLASAAVTVLNERAGLQLVPMPELSPDEQKVLHEHNALFQLIVFSANDLNGGVWITRRVDFDRSFGDGLRFLHDKSGADYALIINGSQVKQSGGGVFAQIAMAALGVLTPGGGTYLYATLVDLEHGELKWFNAKTGVEVMGFTGSDVRAPDEAAVTLRKLFAPYPIIPALGHE